VNGPPTSPSLAPPPAGSRAAHVVSEIARLTVVLMLAVLLETALASNIRVMGANPDFALIVVACVGLLRGAEIGAAFGFFAGTLVSFVLLEPVGVNSFIFVIVGYLAGRYAETADLQSGAAPVVTVFFASLLAQLMFTMTQFLLARQVPFVFVTTRVIVPAVILDTLLAAPAYLVVRMWMRGEVARRAFQTP
jgi:rod shape-determining protein MreD